MSESDSLQNEGGQKEKFNENNDESTQIDTVDLSSKFSELYEYVGNYHEFLK